MTPYEQVRDRYTFPFELRQYQIEEVNRLAEGNPNDFLYTGDKGAQGDGRRIGNYGEPGVGKTTISTHHALYQMWEYGIPQWILLMPPILLPQWGRWLHSITDKETGRPLSVVQYAGTPKQRSELSLDAQFTLMSYQIFKQDFVRLWEAFEDKEVGLIADEAHALKNYKSANHKAVYQFLGDERHRQLLTGTPITQPGDGFAYCRLIAPGRYRNQRHFEQLHAGNLDDFGKILTWQNLEVLAESMRINSCRILRREVQSELPKVIMTPIFYDLAPAHQKLYERLAKERLVEFENGREINAISESALYSSLQQLVLNWSHFADDPTLRPVVLDLVDQVFDEIGDTAKLAIVANFVMSNEMLMRELAQYGCVIIYGGNSSKAKAEALRRFIEDPDCRCILLQPSSAGFGIDGLQHVCKDMLILEAPAVAPPFHQVIARLDRDGQTDAVHCRIAIAAKTVQVKLFKRLLDNDTQINQVQRGFADLRDAVMGTE